MTKIISILFLLTTVTSASADIVDDPNFRQPTVANCDYATPPAVVKVQGCGNLGVCFGEMVCNGTTYTQVSCNAVSLTGNLCPSALDCMNDQSVTFVSAIKPASETVIEDPTGAPIGN